MYIQTHITQKSPCKMMVENCRLVCRSHSSVVKGQCWAFSSPLCQGLLGSEVRLPLPSPQSRYKHRLNPRPVECPCRIRHLRSLGLATYQLVSRSHCPRRIVLGRVSPRARTCVPRYGHLGQRHGHLKPRQLDRYSARMRNRCPERDT